MMDLPSLQFPYASVCSLVSTPPRPPHTDRNCIAMVQNMTLINSPSQPSPPCPPLTDAPTSSSFFTSHTLSLLRFHLLNTHLANLTAHPPRTQHRNNHHTTPARPTNRHRAPLRRLRGVSHSSQVTSYAPSKKKSSKKVLSIQRDRHETTDVSRSPAGRPQHDQRPTTRMKSDDAYPFLPRPVACTAPRGAHSERGTARAPRRRPAVRTRRRRRRRELGWSFLALLVSHFMIGLLGGAFLQLFCRLRQAVSRGPWGDCCCLMSCAAGCAGGVWWSKSMRVGCTAYRERVVEDDDAAAVSLPAMPKVR